VMAGRVLHGPLCVPAREVLRETAGEIPWEIAHALSYRRSRGLSYGLSRALNAGLWYGMGYATTHGGVGVMDDGLAATGSGAGVDAVQDLDAVPGGRHSSPAAGVGKGVWLAGLGLAPAGLAGKIITVAGYKGGVGKTLLAYELALPNAADY